MTDVLLDTHVLLWWATDDRRLSESARTSIASAGRAVVSDVSLWELAIKCGRGKLDLQGGAAAWFEQHTKASRFGELAITRSHLADVGMLPMHHRDPFDRLLIAQALVEGPPIVTSDSAFGDYEVVTIW
jgi:PIN domain nuclease of toxin-antitoxin system